MKNLFIIGCLLQLINCVSIGVEGGSVKCFFLMVMMDKQSRCPMLQQEQMKKMFLWKYIQCCISYLKQSQKTILNITKLQNLKKGKEKDNQNILSKEKEIYLCFQSNDSYYKIFSFDLDISGVDKNFADKNQMDETEGSLKQVLSKMHKVYRNQHFQIDRENYHEKLMESTENQVKWCALCKIVVLMSVCLIQIYMLTNFFKDKSFGPSV